MRPGARWTSDVTNMNALEWVNSKDPHRMLNWLRHRTPLLGDLCPVNISDRKLRLFACACVREVWYAIDDPGSRRAVEAAEQFADGQIGVDDLAQAWADANGPQNQGGSPSRLLAQCARDCAGEHLLRHTHQRGVTGIMEVIAGIFPEQRSRQALLLWEIVGCPMTPICTDKKGNELLWHEYKDGKPTKKILRVDPSWLWWEDRRIPKMAEAIYNDQRWEELPILADALEDAGCTNLSMLWHCRNIGPWHGEQWIHHVPKHVRGCWVIDLLTGRN